MHNRTEKNNKFRVGRTYRVLNLGVGVYCIIYSLKLLSYDFVENGFICINCMGNPSNVYLHVKLMKLLRSSVGSLCELSRPRHQGFKYIYFFLFDVPHTINVRRLNKTVIR